MSAGVKLILLLLCACVSPEQLVISATPLNGCLSDGIEFYAFFPVEEIASIDSQPLGMPLKRSLSALLSKSRCKKEYPQQHPLKAVSLAHLDVIRVDVQTKFKISSQPLFCLKRIKLKNKRQLTPPPFA
jgi:hypothetical protein